MMNEYEREIFSHLVDYLDRLPREVTEPYLFLPGLTIQAKRILGKPMSVGESALADRFDEWQRKYRPAPPAES